MTGAESLQGHRSLHHSGLWDEESVRSHEDGWGKAFANLERALSA